MDNTSADSIVFGVLQQVVPDLFVSTETLEGDFDQLGLDSLSVFQVLLELEVRILGSVSSSELPDVRQLSDLRDYAERLVLERRSDPWSVKQPG